MLSADVYTESLALIREILEFGEHGSVVRCGRKRVFINKHNIDGNDDGIVTYGLYNDGIYVTLTHDANEAYDFLRG